MEIKVLQKKNGKKKTKLKVCAYVRVSTDSLEQEDSLDNQTAYFDRFIRSNPNWEFSGIYADQGISGFKESRPQFQKMIADAKDGKIDLIVVKSISRFARNTETVLKFSRELKSIGVGIFFTLQNINPLSGEGELMLTVLAAFAQAESEGASDNAKLMYRRKFEAGVPSQSLRFTFGFDADAEGNPCIQEEQAATVRLIYDLAEKGVWPSKIRQHLNDRGIPGCSGGTWDDTAIFRVLQNPAYKGDLVLQKTYQDSSRKRYTNEGQTDQWYILENHPAIVQPEQWDTVQEIIQKRSQQVASRPSQKPSEPRSSLTRYPLTNMLYCPLCGEKLIHKWANNGKHEYWACKTNLKKGSKVCKGIWLPAAIANSWGKISEPTTAFVFEDEYGMRQYTAYPKEEYDISDDCLYQRKEA